MALLYVLHQDFWFWRDARPLVFGFLPIGLFYHAAFTVASSLVLWLLVRLCVARASRSAKGARRMIPALVVFAYLGDRPLHRHLCVSHVDGRATPKTISWPAVARARPCSCCRCSART